MSMSALYVLLIVSLLVAAGFLVAYLVSVRKGQFDDDTTPAMRILFDDDAPAGHDAGPGAAPSVTDEAGTPVSTHNPTH